MTTIVKKPRKSSVEKFLAFRVITSWNCKLSLDACESDGFAAIKDVPRLEKCGMTLYPSEIRIPKSAVIIDSLCENEKQKRPMQALITTLWRRLQRTGVDYSASTERLGEGVLSRGLKRAYQKKSVQYLGKELPIQTQSLAQDQKGTREL